MGYRGKKNVTLTTVSVSFVHPRIMKGLEVYLALWYSWAFFILDNCAYNVYILIKRWGDMFEWDENKRHINIEKHGIDFVDAKELWLGEVIEIISPQTSHGETRINPLLSGSRRDK